MVRCLVSRVLGVDLGHMGLSFGGEGGSIGGLVFGQLGLPFNYVNHSALLVRLQGFVGVIPAGCIVV